MIIWDDNFFTELDDCYMVYITGRLGSGKTMLAVEIAERYLRRGYKLLSQIACVWNDKPEDMVMDEKGHRRVVAIIDELGLHFRTAKESGMISSFARKQNTYLIFSGRKPPHEDLTELTVQLWFDFMKWFLIPLKVWRYDKVNAKKTYSGYMVQTCWWEYWGIYDTLDPGDSPEDIVSLFAFWTEEYFKRYGRKVYKFSTLDKSGRDDESEFNNEFASSVRKMADEAKNIKTLSKPKIGGWR